MADTTHRNVGVPSFDLDMRIVPLTERKISQETCQKYGVAVGYDTQGNAIEQHYALKKRDGTFGGRAIRLLPKDFRMSVPDGVHTLALFGSHLFPGGSSRSITVTEGHIDALSAYEMQGSKWPVVSVNTGAGGARKEFQLNLEYLESFEHVYICFDADAPGQQAAIACANILSPGKAKIVRLDPGLKDASGYKTAGKEDQFVKAWWQAQTYTPAGILNGATVLDRIRNAPEIPSIPFPFDGLNKKTYGIRRGEAIIVTADTGVGKTSILREFMYGILQADENAKIGTMFLEETPSDTGLGVMSLYAQKPLHLPDTEYTEEEFEKAAEILRSDRVYFYDSFGSNSIDEIVSRVRYYAKGLGCQYIFLDHLSIVVSDQSQGDERKALDAIMTRLKTLTIELNIALIAVVHVNRQGEIKGTSSIKQLANIVIELDRDVNAADEMTRSTLFMRVSKNRFSGQTGPAGCARYNTRTGRMEELTEAFTGVTDKEMKDVFGETTGSDNPEIAHLLGGGAAAAA